MANRSSAATVRPSRNSGIHSVPPAPKTPHTPTASHTPKSPRVVDVGVVAQVKTALAPKNRLATFAGFLLGGLVPMATFAVAHYEVSGFFSDPRALLVLGGLLFSAKTVYAWGTLAFQNAAKALGFVVLVEGVMIFSASPWLAFVCLAYLVTINGIATGCLLSRGVYRTAADE